MVNGVETWHTCCRHISGLRTSNFSVFITDRGQQISVTVFDGPSFNLSTHIAEILKIGMSDIYFCKIIGNRSYCNYAGNETVWFYCLLMCPNNVRKWQTV